MMSLLSSILCMSMTLLVSSSPIDSSSSVYSHNTFPNCTDIVIPITISAQNFVLPIPPSGSPSLVAVQGAYNIAARYCEPSVKVLHRANTLQFLVHGGSYDRNYWSGDGAPGQGYHGSQYSWIDFASSLGYPTLSIDRLCNGLSDHPDPVGICQFNAQVEAMHEVITKARNGGLPGTAGRHFDKIVYAGHSIGSMSGNLLSAKYPNDVNTMILTGWSKNINLATFYSLALPALVPGALVSPVKYGNLDPNYLIVNVTSIFGQLFYRDGAYDPALFNLDYSLRGTFPLGEGTVIPIQSATLAPQFRGSVLALTGQYDALFCPPLSNVTTGCGAGWSTPDLSTSGSLFPAASSFDTYSLPGVAHCWHFHYAAPAGFAIAHSWLNSKGF